MMSPISWILHHWQKAGGGGIKGDTHTHTKNKKHENGPSLKIWLLFLEWYFLFYLAVCCQCSYFYHFFSPSGVLFVLDVDYYKDGKISSSSSELHGSLVVMACIKLAPREQGSGWTSLEGGRGGKEPTKSSMHEFSKRSLHPGSFYTSSTFPLVRFYILVCSKSYWIYNKGRAVATPALRHMKTLNHIQ